MKTLVLVRHAKSNWDNPDTQDFDRPLNKRGNSDAPFMAILLKKKNFFPDLIIASPANRALTTAQYFATHLDYSQDKIITDENIYNNGVVAIKNVVSNLNNDLSNVLLFGHNPDITYLASKYTTVTFDNVPTCGVVCIDFDIDSWGDIADRSGKLRFFEFPKKYIWKA